MSADAEPSTQSPDEGSAAAASAATPGLRQLGAKGLELLSLRAELLATELEAEKLRWFESLAWLALLLLFASAALAMLSLGLVWLVPAGWRWAAALALGLIYALLAWTLWQRAQRAMAGTGSPFAKTFEELARDRASLGEG
ncbi:phage holin family protein [Paucibacter sp. APW11]|uniref:Phage holin family protein n=1 Tax=Roseateles aquae TaxID=3077235 RepID=A0ABU3PF20_9BURK|nr:phage holin family protein [Paucibacter sp. APW11]MDT9000703.1 phage holin family protein [Paucibacter sp. APW11]